MKGPETKGNAMTTTARQTLVIALAAIGMVIAVGFTIPAANAGHQNPVLEADLDGRSEMAANNNNRIVGDPNGRGQIYVFGIDGDPGRTTLCYVLTVDGIAELDLAPSTPPRMAHIHEGAPGENGPVVASLAWPQDGQSADCISTDQQGKFFEGVTPADIFDKPGDYYVNVHNGVYPAGALRGQLGSR
jgi:hypothetical protein